MKLIPAASCWGQRSSWTGSHVDKHTVKLRSNGLKRVKNEPYSQTPCCRTVEEKWSFLTLSNFLLLLFFHVFLRTDGLNSQQCSIEKMDFLKESAIRFLVTGYVFHSHELGALTRTHFTIKYKTVMYVKHKMDSLNSDLLLQSLCFFWLSTASCTVTEKWTVFLSYS